LFRHREESWGEAHAELLKLGPELEPYIEALPGLRLTRPSDPVETLFSFLCSSNNHVPRIKAMVEQLASFGPVMTNEAGRNLHRFPEIEAIAQVSESELRGRGFGYRAATIPVAARELAHRGGREYLEQLRLRPLADVRKELISLPGVGPKLADCIALFALDRTECVPIDTHIWQAASRLYFPDWQGTQLTAKKYDAVTAFIVNRFGRLAGWAQQYLFYENLLHWRERRVS
jgi:N-glycosylase/DNA lyase